MIINGLEFRETCYACPEQYDVFDKDGNQVGYVRLRHGYLYAQCPDIGGEDVYDAYPDGDGRFINEYERNFHLNAIAKEIELHINRNTAGYHDSELINDLILEKASASGDPDDYDDEDWSVICEIFGTNPNKCVRVRIPAGTKIGYFNV